MQEKVFLNIFILCVLFSIEASSNLLVREKRVINRLRGQDVPVQHGNVPYVVNIKVNGDVRCVGTILSHHTVITAARCATLDAVMYSVYSGSINAYLGHFHKVVEKKLYGHSPSRSDTVTTGIALLIVQQPFEFSPTTNKLELHTGPVIAGEHGTISGWGTCHYGRLRETGHTSYLRSISVPIMSHRECVNIYRGIFKVREEDVCTYDEQKQCGFTDAGAPLVLDNELAGVHIGVIETSGREVPIKPDVFVLLQHFQYGAWIRENIVM